MTSFGTVISYPIPPYQNVPIQAEYYQPSRFLISDINYGQTTTIMTTVDHNYVIGQTIRLIIPAIYGPYELNNLQGIVISIPSVTQVVVSIYSKGSETFVPFPYKANITNITTTDPVSVTANNPFHAGNRIIFSQVGGMVEINGLVGTILTRSPTGFTVNINSSIFSSYSSGGQAILFEFPQNMAQILAIGNINSGALNTSGRSPTSTLIPGSFEDISPL